MSDRAPGRHRAPQSPTTPLTPLAAAVGERVNQLGSAPLIVAVSSGLLATGGIPLQQFRQPHTPIQAAVLTETSPSPAAAPLDQGLPTAGTPVTAPAGTSVMFDRASFTTEPRPAPASAPRSAPRHRAGSAAVITTSAGSTTRLPAPSTITVRRATTAVRPPTVSRTLHRAPTRPPAKPPTVQARTTTKQRASTAPIKTKAPTKTRRTVQRPSTPAPAPSGARGSAVITIAARYLGVPYVYGGTTPRGFDCSGYVQYVYARLGVRLPRTADQQLRATRHIPRSQARPGDLVAFVSGGTAYHIGIYAGDGMMYDAPRTGKTVTKRAIWSAAVIFTRVTG